MLFKDFNLHPAVLKALEDEGYVNPTPIQERAIPQVIAGHDVMASAQTGTGKTAAFMLPLLHRILEKPATVKTRGPRALILAPTRELAFQIATATEAYCRYLPHIKTVTIVGGMPYPVQNRQMSRPYDVMVATPGRLIDHLERGSLDFKRLEVLVLDEADRMLDMGFLPDVERIMQQTPADRQTLLFSATLQGAVGHLVNKFMKNPVEINVSPQRMKVSIEQRLLYVDDMHHKNRLLEHFLTDESLKQTIVFTATKRHAEKLVDDLRERGHKAAPLHGDMRQNARNKTIERLRRGSIRVLVATDVAARGIDVSTVTHVINFDLPRCSEDYVHRIGRTGRIGAQGTAISFMSNQDTMVVRKIEQELGKSLTRETIPGLEPKTKPTPVYTERRPQRSGGGQRRGNWGGYGQSRRSSGPRSNNGYRGSRSASY